MTGDKFYFESSWKCYRFYTKAEFNLLEMTWKCFLPSDHLIHIIYCKHLSNLYQQKVIKISHFHISNRYKYWISFTSDQYQVNFPYLPIPQKPATIQKLEHQVPKKLSTILTIHYLVTTRHSNCVIPIRLADSMTSNEWADNVQYNRPFVPMYLFVQKLLYHLSTVNRMSL